MARKSGRPEMCERIRTERLRLKSEWAHAHPSEDATGRNRYSQWEVAGRAGVTAKTWQAWETRHEPSPPRLRQIAEALDLPPSFFLPDPVAARIDDELASLIEAQAAEIAALKARLEKLSSQMATMRGQISAIHAAAEELAENDPPPARPQDQPTSSPA